MSNSPAHQIQDLNAEELDWVHRCMATFVGMVEDAVIPVEDLGDTPEIADALVSWWRSSAERTRPDANDVATAVSIAIGDYCIACFSLDWKIVTDEFGTSLCLVGEDEDKNPLILSPLDSIAKRFGSEPDGFVSQFVEGLFQVDRLQPLRREPREEHPE